MGLRQRVILTLLGAGAIALGMFVLITARELDIHLLACVGIIGGVAMIVVGLPTK